MVKQKKPEVDYVFSSFRSFMNEGDVLADLTVEDVNNGSVMTSPFKKCRFSRVNYSKTVRSLIDVMKEETSVCEVVVLVVSKPLNDGYGFSKTVDRTVGVLRNAGLLPVSTPPLGVNGIYCVTFDVGDADDVLVVHFQLIVKNDDNTTLASLFLDLCNGNCLLAAPVLEPTQESDDGKEVCETAHRTLTTPRVEQTKGETVSNTKRRNKKEQASTVGVLNAVSESFESFMKEGNPDAIVEMSRGVAVSVATCGDRECHLSHVNYHKTVLMLLDLMKEIGDTEAVVRINSKPVKDGYLFHREVEWVIELMRVTGIRAQSAPSLGVNSAVCVTFSTGATDDVLVVEFDLLCSKNTDSVKRSVLFRDLIDGTCLLASHIRDRDVVSTIGEPDTPPWEDIPDSTSKLLDRKITDIVNTPVKTGTLFLMEQNGDDERLRINSVMERLNQTFKTLEVDIYADLRLLEKLSDYHKPLKDQIRDILLQGKSVAVLWRSDMITGELSNLAAFTVKVLEWVEMAREIKAPHYYIGNF